jgi:hypothetical protein
MKTLVLVETVVAGSGDDDLVVHHVHEHESAD